MRLERLTTLLLGAVVGASACTAAREDADVSFTNEGAAEGVDSGLDDESGGGESDDGVRTDHPDDRGADGADGGGTGPVRILPLGDSLTFGTSASVGSSELEGGYRIELYDRLAAAGYEVDYVGTSSNGPAGFDGDHESEPGASIEVIADHWDAASAIADLDVVLLLGGTNDQLGITADQPPEQAAAALGGLIDRIFEDAPGVSLVVAKLPPLVPGLLVGAEQPGRIEAYNALLPKLVQARRDAGRPIYLVDLSLLNPNLLGDGVHPSTMQGYDAMATMWYPAVVSAIEDR